jgi:hypothetical protein
MNSDLPKILVTASAPKTHTAKKGIIARLLGPIVIKFAEFFFQQF